VARQGSLLETARRHAALVSEMEGMLRETIFTDLPQRERRAELLTGVDGTNLTEAMYVIDRLHKSMHLPGDVCEFGVAQGTTSAILANELIDGGKNLWLFDSFEGLPAPTDKDVLIDDILGLKSMAAYQGEMAFARDLVEAKLASVGFPPERTKIVKGFVPQSFEGVELPKEVCFAYVDFDFYEPILVALEFLGDRLPVGGHVVVDDYGFFSSGARTAVDEFLVSHPGDYDFSLPYNSAGHFCMLTKLR